jgi:fumarylacetoacetase
MIDHTHNPAATCWVEGADSHADFPVQNLPLGVFTPPEPGFTPRIGTAIGDYVLDLAVTAAAGWLGKLPDELYDALTQPSLNALLALDPAYRKQLRHAVFALLTDPSWQNSASFHLWDRAGCTMHLPAHIGDYTDFYVGIHHATNIGKQFRPENPLLPNYKHIPIGYHGRASSIRPSGTPVIRPSGQRKAPDSDVPEYGPTRRLDFELELGVWIAGENQLGEPVPIATAHDRIAGLCLLNDWSARDFQAWEYQPLGPFLAKNFMTSISSWVITAEALAPFRKAQAARPEGDPQPLPYLWDKHDQAEGAFAIDLEVTIETAKMREGGIAPHRLSASSAAHMYWTAAQMVTHHASNGCNLLPGDILGTGTISGPDRSALGSLAEISRGGAEPVELPTGETRSFLEDDDRLTLLAKASAAGYRSIGFGECSGTVRPVA